MIVTDLGRCIKQNMDNDRIKAEQYLLFYEERLTEYKKEKAEAMAQAVGKNENVGGGRSGIISRPTENQALREVNYDEEHDEYYWLKAVEILQRTMGEWKNIFLQARREAEQQKGGSTGRPAWVAHTQMRYIQEMDNRYPGKMIAISEKTVKVWWRKMIDRTVEIYLRLKR